MTPTDAWTRSPSPFHAGELAVQERLGVRQSVEGFARKAIRPFMPEQHRDFFAALPLLHVGHVDDGGRPWASMLAGRPGFVASPDPRTLVIDASPFAGDPLAAGLRRGAALGLLGMTPADRRRNRLNGRIAAVEGTRVTLAVDQSFGNCPQYIQTRDLIWTRDPTIANEPAAVERLTGLDERARALIAAADRFFVATASANAAEDAGLNGADVSHRGGRPGFVRVEGDTLTIPDFPGNRHYTTLGNILSDPHAGLTFADDATGDLLMLTGAAEIVWEGPEVSAFRGAELLWRFHVAEALRLPGALPMRWAFGAFSPNTLLTGDWAEAAATLAAETKRDVWRPFRIARIADESAVIRSFTLEPADGDGTVASLPGQHLPIRVTPPGAAAPLSRIYTLSSAPNDRAHRISVKREPGGAVSSWLHDAARVGDVIEARAPRGGFTLDTAEKRPAVLIAGGVGVTPMIAMARQAASEGLRTRHIRPLTVIHAARTAAERAFADEFSALAAETMGRIRYVSVIGRPEEGEIAGRDFDHAGRIDAALLRATLALDDYDFFLCGPGPFMQAVYDALRALGVRDARIFAEAFGPSALVRTPDGSAPAAPAATEADEAVVVFGRAGFEQRWSRGEPPLLALAEAHGLNPDFGCRGGSCGTCATRIVSGAVTYRETPTADHGPDTALICCALPATDRLELDL
jgi:ferredoxin-NADP reductase/predicted pyridoxine 5'-phosphate oxidase superfamily flavin-nucleotide-binding protein